MDGFLYCMMKVEPQTQNVCSQCRLGTCREFSYFRINKFSNFWHNDSLGNYKNNSRALFSKKKFGPEIFGVLGDFGPKISLLDFFSENGANDFLDFLHNAAEQCL